MPFRAGGYVQIECPPHALEFRTFDIDPEFRDVWDKFDLWRFKSRSDVPIERAYSMANYPSERASCCSRSASRSRPSTARTSRRAS